MAKRLDVKQLRKDHGMSQADLARHVWGEDVQGDTLKHRVRTIAKWENDGITPGPLHAKHLRELQEKQTPKDGEGEQAPPAPRRRPVGGMLPSMGDS